jgi:hypothetical protein
MPLPVPDAPLPVAIEMRPAAEVAALPVDIETAPEGLDLEAPDLMATEPVAWLSADCMITLPLAPVFAFPLDIFRSPPVAVLLPPLMVTLPPVASVLCPGCNRMEPTSLVALPVRSEIDPLALARTDPVAREMPPLPICAVPALVETCTPTARPLREAPSIETDPG